MLPPSVALVDAIRMRSPVRTLPDGSTVVARLTATRPRPARAGTARSFSGSTRTTIVRWLPPNGGGADTPGSVAKIGRTRLSAMSCISGTAARRAREDQLRDRHAAGVEAHDERRHGARRHERARAVDVADHFGHRLAHVGVRMEHQLHERDALNVLGLDVLDAGDVEEVVLVVVGEVAFHLRRIHAAVRLRDVDRGRAQLRKDVDLHLPDRQDRRERNRHDRDQNRDRPSHGREH